jgi:hypothetical protein
VRRLMVIEFLPGRLSRGLFVQALQLNAPRLPEGMLFCFAATSEARR